MNCYNPMTGACEQSHGCPVRETPYDKAAWHFWEPNAPLHIDVAEKPPLHIRALDWIGNLPHKVRKFAKDQDFDSPAEMLLVAAVLVFACCMIAPLLVGWVTL